MNFNSTKNPQLLPLLPFPKQNWAHSTCALDELSNALSDPFITAIEADIVMGYDINDDNPNNIQPIMAHPPSTESDLSFQLFLSMVQGMNYKDRIATSTNNSTITGEKSWGIKKHLKLDFKDIETVGRVLDIISKSMEHNDSSIESNKDYGQVEEKTIYLNADVILGPGLRNDALSVPSDDFLEPCISFLKHDPRRQKQFAFSLGWKTDCRSFTGYNQKDVEAMEEIIEKNNLLSFSQGIVLAVNARVLVKNPHSFDSFLMKYSQSAQLLAWTGTGEPPISKSKISKIQRHFEANGCVEQVGFDCKIAPSYFSGMFYDNAVNIVGLFWNAQKYFSSLFKK